MSVAAGVIAAGTRSKIHVHPYIDQVTVLVSGELDIVMKDCTDETPPYRIELRRPQNEVASPAHLAAVLSRGGDFFQLDNRAGSVDATVLYITMPCYVYERGAGTESPPVFDDAIVVGEDWDALAAAAWTHPALEAADRTYRARRDALARLSAAARG